MNRYVSEMIGTTVLVLVGCGGVVFAGDIPGTVTTGVSAPGVAITFGLSVVAMAYVIDGISRCHINPAVTLGMYCSGGMGGKDALLHTVLQITGGILGSAVFLILVSTGPHAGPTMIGGNGFVEGEMLQTFIAEAVLTFIFVLVALRATDKKKGTGKLADLVVGLTLILMHTVCIPIIGTSVNPARSIGPTLSEGGSAISQLRLFIVAPLTGGLVNAIVWKTISQHSDRRR